MQTKSLLKKSNFLNWFSGFIDGEGMFGAYQANKKEDKEKIVSRIIEVKISLRDDDYAILKEIKNRIGVGRLLKSVKNGNSNRQSVWIVSNIPELYEVILPIFIKYPLRTKKKRDFKIFKEIVEMQYSTYHLRKKRTYSNKLNNLFRKLKEVKNYGK